MVSKILKTSLLLAVGVCIAGSAWAEDANFSFINKTNETIFVKAFSRTRDHTWPGKRHNWVLQPGQSAVAVAGECQAGEKLCYGAANQAGTHTWADSLTGGHGCANCCIQCGEHHLWNLIEGADPVKQPAGNLANDQVLVPIDE